MLKRSLTVLLGILCLSSVIFAEAPSIRALFPNTGYTGGKVCIIGKYFDAASENNTVSFGEVEAEIQRCNQRFLSVVVPDGLEAGEYNVTVTTGEGTSEPVTFTVIEPGVPEITGIHPESGCVGRLVKINGTNLGMTGDEVTVVFGDVETPGKAWGRVVYTRVPEGVLGDITVKVKVGDVESNEVAFTVTETPVPVITSIAPESGAPGDMVLIHGENFCRTFGFFFTRNRTKPNLKVLFDGTEAKVLFTCWHLILAVVPSDIVTGSVNVTVAVGESTSEPVTFDVVSAPAPVVDSLTPDTGPVGSFVRIKGENLGGFFSDIEVSFNGTAAEKLWAPRNGSMISVMVPAGTTTGPVSVTVNGVEADNKPVFTVEESPQPEILSIDPASGPSGSRVTIKGNNLCAPFLKPKVLFGETEAKIIFFPFCSPWNRDGEDKAQVIFVLVPRDLPIGDSTVTVVSGEATSNGVNFEVTEPGDEMPAPGPIHDRPPRR